MRKKMASYHPMISLYTRKKLEVYLYFVPAMGVLAFSVLYPWIWSFVMSFHKWRIGSGLGPQFNGITNYLRVLQDPLFRMALRNSLTFMLISVALQFFMGFAIALLLNRKLPMRRFLMVGVLLPYMLTPTMAGLVWKILMHGNWGLINHYLRAMGVSPVDWLGNPDATLWSISIIAAWLHTPWVALMLFAGLQAVPEDLLEAARVDGANSWRTFYYVTLPSVRPLIVIVLMFRVVFSLREFDVIYALFSSGGPGNSAMVLGVYLYDTFNLYWDIGRSSAISFIILIITIVLSGMFLIRRGGKKA